MKKIFPFVELHSPDHPVAALSSEQLNLVQEYNRKAQEHKIEFEEVPCLCGNRSFELLATFDRYAFHQSTVLCIQCGLVQSNPRMTAAEYARFYSSDSYRRCYDSEDYILQYEKKYVAATGKHILDEVLKVKKIDSGSLILEIGAGGGWNLLAFKEVGAKVLGSDYSPSLVQLGIEHGIPMVEGSSETVQGRFDVIILNHVLEHILNPVDALKKIASHLNEGGMIYIAVPNINNSPLTQFQNAHTYYFDPETFVYYCSQAGLMCIINGPAQKFHMFGIFGKGQALQMLSLKGHYQKVLQHLNWIKTRRQASNCLKAIGIGEFAKSVYFKLRWR